MKRKFYLIAALASALLIAPSCGDDDDPVEPTPVVEPIPDDKPVENPDDKPVDNPVDNPTDKPDDKPADNPSDKPAEEVYKSDIELIDDEPDNPVKTKTIFLCFGQSNMEGNADVEEYDRLNVPANMVNMIVAKDDPKHYGAKRYSWRKADPPLARFNTGLTPADYFGRKMLEYLPANDTVGIVMVAIGGADIAAFIKDDCVKYCKRTDHAGWYKNYLAQYDNDPYGVLVKAAKKAQKTGVIRGILLHQGETNNGQSDWPNKVKKIYNDLLADLNLTAEECPLLVGETVREDMGGCCSWHNTVVAKVPNVIPTAHVISSEGCMGKNDALHFLASGYRTLGKRYAYKMLSLMGIQYEEEVEEVVEPVEEVDNAPAGELAKEDALDFANFSPSIYAEGTFDSETKTFVTGQYGFAGWYYDKGADFSSAKYLVVELEPGCEAIGSYEFSFRLYHKNDYWTEPAIFMFGNNSTIKIDLQDMKDKNGAKVFPAHIYYAGFWTVGGVSATIKSIRFED